MSPRTCLRALGAALTTALAVALLALVPAAAYADPAAAPTAPIRYLSTPNATPLTVNLCSGASDPQGDPISLAAIGPNGWALTYDKQTCLTTITAVGNGGNGELTYQLTDGTNVSDWLSVKITFGQPGNAPVVAQPDTLAAAKGLKKVVSDLKADLAANDTDPEGSAVSVTSIVAESGLLPGEDLTNASWMTPTTWVYTPPTSFVGTRRFVYTVSDGANATRQVLTITITDQGPPKAPVANPDSYVVARNGSLVMTKATGVLVNDTDADSAYIEVGGHGQPSHGTLSSFKAAAGTWTYTPQPGYVGPDSFQYQARDSEGLTSAYVTVSLTVKTIAPVAADDAVQVAKDGSLVVAFATLTANDTDTDSAFDISNVVPGTHGTVLADWAARTLTYTPATGYTGSDTFGYRLTDVDANTSNWALVTVTVVPPLVNQAPVAKNDAYEIHQGHTLTVAAAQGVLANDTDFEDEDLDVAFRGAAQHGSFTDFDFETGAFAYQPEAGWHGTETVTYTSKDPKSAASNTATITIVVRNDAPVAVADSYQAVSGVPLVVPAGQGVLVNDTDAEGGAITGSSWSIPEHAKLVYANDGSFTLTPDAGYVGVVTFWYTIRDELLQESEQATVTVTVAAAPPVVDEPATNAPAGAGPGAIEAGTPRISGRARVGHRLKAVPGVWGPAPVVLSYQWFRNGRAITGATKAGYRLKARDRGKKVCVQVTGTRPAYAVVVRVSAAKRVR